MKLLLCIGCNHIFSLSREERRCSCGNVGGKYDIDGLHAEYFGEDAIPLGFANFSFVMAIKRQREQGDLTERMSGSYEGEVKGREFTAFIIPESSSTMIRSKGKRHDKQHDV